MRTDFRNPEGYLDTVPFEALRTIRYEEKAARHVYRPLVYICSPYAGDTETNTENARRYCRFAVDTGTIPLAPHLLLPQFMSDETERDQAMFMNKVILGRCAELWVFGDTVTAGMKAEIAYAKRGRKTIRYFTEDCEEKK